MSIRIPFFVALSFISQAVFAQPEIEGQVKSLTLNSSPAYVVLGVEPENIQRPNSPTEFIAGVQSAMVNQRLQPNFAMETTPYYWGKKKPDSVSKRYNMYDFHLKDDYWLNLAKSITFSFATSPSDSFTFGKIPVGTGLGIGVHMQLCQGKVSPNVRRNLINWYVQNKLALFIDDLIETLDQVEGKTVNVDEWLDDLLSKGNNKNMSEGEKELIRNVFMEKLKKKTITGKDSKLLRKLSDAANKKSQDAIGNVNKYQFPLTREGFMLELAIANASVAGGNNWNKLQSAKTSIWLTPSYRFNVNKDPEVIDFIDLMAVARLTINAKNVDSSSYLDAGAKLQWVHNKLSISGEGVFRYLTKKPVGQVKGYTLRTGFTLSYKLNDMITFMATFGSNFDGNSTHYSDPDKMFAVGGFHFGFSNFLKKENGSSVNNN